MSVKEVEKSRLAQRLRELDAQNDEMKPLLEQIFQQATDASAELRARKQSASNMLVVANAIAA